MINDIPIAKLSEHTVREFNNLIHQAIEINYDYKTRTMQIFKIWKYFLKTNIHEKENPDGTIGDGKLKFGVMYHGKQFTMDDLMNNMVLCHNLFTTKGKL